MTTTSADTTDLSENATGNEDQDRTSTPGTMTQATLVPTADNMNMERIFFLYQTLGSSYHTTGTEQCTDGGQWNQPHSTPRTWPDYPSGT